MRGMGGVSAFLAAAVLVLPGCSGGDGSRPTAGSGLRAAMAEVSGDGPAALHFEYGDMAHWRELGVVTGQGPGQDKTWLPAVGYGLGELSRAGRLLTEKTGIAPYAADHAVSIGVPPDTAVRVDGGVDAGTVEDKLTGLGGRPGKVGEHDGLSLADDHALDPQGPLIELGLLNQFNKAVVTGSTVAVGTAAAPVSAALGGTRSLAEVPSHAAVADCLGDVVTATVTVPGDSRTVALYGVGLRRPAAPGDTAVNVICVVPKSGAIPSVRQAFTTGLTTEASTTQGKPYGGLAKEITHDEVVNGDVTVLRATLTLTSGTSVTFAHQMLARGELDGVAGSGDPVNLLTPTPAPSS
ncbi:hypothetical protein HS041_22660 [Planomonospora sp. ID67723]|uniref:hypothetical protein n=1 Tax=Planomonospora sp. ID67723 TaxID=2738134 RepID=UPI0018C35872|nr:hypothetical protein [Planomonospora sp. ID67723]MBG0830568.1 hypothetical protein [Planomonospora sp. ID67723]